MKDEPFLVWRPGLTLRQIECEAAAQALKHYGTKTGAAQGLDIALRTIRNWVNSRDELKEFRYPSFDAFKARLSEFERKLITEALSIAEDNHAEAARYLGLKRTTLVEKMRRYGLLKNEAA